MEKKQAKKTSNFKQYIILIYNVLLYLIPCVVAFGYGAPLEPQTIEGKLFWLGVEILSIYVAFIFHIIVHEGGHLVFGLLSGYRFSSFRVFSLMWVKEGEKIKLRRLKMAGTGGQCLMSPPDIKDGMLPVVWYNLGGSLMNIFFGLLFLGAFFLCGGVSYLSVILLLFALFGFALAILNGVPLRTESIDNDGYNAIALSKNAEAREAFWVQMKIVEESTKGVRQKDMPAEWFTAPSDEAMQNSMVAARGVFACSRLMDEENFAAADELMAHMLSIESGMAGAHRYLLVGERLYIELISQNRRDVVEGMLTQAQKSFMKAMKTYPSIIRTQYAYALLFEQDEAKAKDIRAQFEKHAKTYPYPHEIDSERDLMAIVDAKYRESEAI